MRQTHVVIVAAVLLVAALVPSAVAVTITQQDRNINGWVWISGCPQQVQSDAAINLDPFMSKVAVEPPCALGQGVATASQDSTLNENQFIATGAGHFNVGANQSTVIHSMARSRFDIEFTLTEPKQYSLTGSIAASRFGTNPASGNMAYTTVTLAEGEANLYTLTLQPALNQSLSQEVSSAGDLQPGAYRITAHSQAFVDQSFNNTSVQADVSFDIVLTFDEVENPADITGNGIVDVDDLLIVINAWGDCDDPCPPSCSGDVNDDCQTDVDDLLTVINNWGPV